MRLKLFICKQKKQLIIFKETRDDEFFLVFCKITFCMPNYPQHVGVRPVVNDIEFVGIRHDYVLSVGQLVFVLDCTTFVMHSIPIHGSVGCAHQFCYRTLLKEAMARNMANFGGPVVAIQIGKWLRYVWFFLRALKNLIERLEKT